MVIGEVPKLIHLQIKMEEVEEEVIWEDLVGCKMPAVVEVALDSF